MGCDLKYAGRYAEGAQHDFLISRKNRHRAQRATEQQTRREGPAPGLCNVLLRNKIILMLPAASGGPSNWSGPERQKKLENTRIELVTYRMRSGRSTTELIPHTVIGGYFYIFKTIKHDSFCVFLV